jgi:hydroxyacylglutathione hydrolase
MASSSETARAYYNALSDHDLDGAVALWKPGAGDRIVGQAEHVAPDGLRDFLGGLFAAFPDWHNEVLETTTQRGRCAVRWRATATFAGPGRLDGFVANGGRVSIEGCDVLAIEDGQITGSHVFMDRVDLLAQLGLVSKTGAGAGRGRTALTNARQFARRTLTGGAAKVIAPGVWVVPGGVSPTMNVYLVAEAGGGVTVFDAGVRAMTPAVAAATARLGGIRRIVLGHADCDHRGAAPGLRAPVYTHALEVEAAQSPANRRTYWDLRRLTARVRPVYPLLFRSWDGGAVEVAGTVAEGDEIAGFRVIELPGHAPGLIGLFREEDGLVLCSDALYTVNVETSLPCGPRVPHPAFNLDTEQARASLLKLAALEPRVVWPGHSRPVAGPGVPERLATAARS